MSVRQVADMMALAGEGLAVAKDTGDAELRQNSVELAVRAMTHPDAAAFFAGIQLALAESDTPEEEPWGNDPAVLDNGFSPVETNVGLDGIVQARRVAGRS